MTTQNRNDLRIPVEHPTPIQVAPRSEYSIHIEFSDGSAGEIDLSSWAGNGVFKQWESRDFFKSVRIDSFGSVLWGEELNVCSDTLYMMLTGIPEEELYPRLLTVEIENT